MQVILLKEVEKLGEEGEIVSVKNGYGRNYLIPQGLARLATPGAIKAQKEEERQASRKRLQEKENAEQLAAEMANMELVVTAKVGEENRIFGTVTSQQVALQLATKGIQIDRRKIELDEDIKVIGVYTASVKLHPKVTATVKVRVEPTTDDEGY